MNPGLKKLIDGKRAAMEPLSTAEQNQGFKGWYASRNLPHFDGPGVTQFLTWRLADSLPAGKRHEWEAYLHLEDDEQRRRQIEKYIDLGHGSCHLRNPTVAELVQGSLWHSDGKQYALLAWVIMPNHVHVLVETWTIPMGTMMQRWKGFMARQANKLLGTKGEFWAEDYFDRYIRDEDHLRRVRKYIENNPVKAGLVKSSEDWLWSSAQYRNKENPAKLLHRQDRVSVD